MTAKKRGPWIVNGVTRAFENPWIRIDDYDVVQPHGAPGRYGVVGFANKAIGILPIDAEGHTWIVGQHRFPFDRYSWELPEGGGPHGEPSIEAAKRELQEETGLSAAHWLSLMEFDLSNSVTDEHGECFLAWGLTEGETAPDPTEVLERRRIPYTQLREMVVTGEIRDSLTIMMTLMADLKARRGELPGDVAKWLLA